MTKTNVMDHPRVVAILDYMQDILDDHPEQFQQMCDDVEDVL